MLRHNQDCAWAKSDVRKQLKATSVWFDCCCFVSLCIIGHFSSFFHHNSFISFLLLKILIWDGHSAFLWTAILPNCQVYDIFICDLRVLDCTSLKDVCFCQSLCRFVSRMSIRCVSENLSFTGEKNVSVVFVKKIMKKV